MTRGKETKSGQRQLEARGTRPRVATEKESESGQWKRGREWPQKKSQRVASRVARGEEVENYQRKRGREWPKEERQRVTRRREAESNNGREAESDQRRRGIE